MSFPGMNPFADRPVFACFLFDSSASMDPYVDDVIAGHRIMLDTLRKSEVCANGALFVQQALFSESMHMLNTPVELDKGGLDSVTVLDSSNYAPDGMTALYDSLVTLLEELLVVMNDAHDNYDLEPSARLAIITDGADNQSKQGSQQKVWELVQELKAKEWLTSSLVIGLKNQSFDDKKLEKLRMELNFSQAISLGQDGKSVRRAFQLASQQRQD